MSGWGSQSWGASAWGGATGNVLSLLTAIAVRENVVRLVFNRPVYFSRILDRYDASNPVHFTMTAITEAVDPNGDAPRAVSVVAVAKPDALSVPPVLQVDFGTAIDLVLDRPMSAYPALYDVVLVNLQAADGSSVLATATLRLAATLRELQSAIIDTPATTRDFANPQTEQALKEIATVDPTAIMLGTYPVADDGDYAFDSGATSRKKRIFRRIYTRKGGFVHLPNYGVGIKQYGKKLARFDVVAKMTSDATLQIQQEPDVAKAFVTADIPRNHPNLLKLHIATRDRAGLSAKFTVPVPLV